MFYANINCGPPWKACRERTIGFVFAIVGGGGQRMTIYLKCTEKERSKCDFIFYNVQNHSFFLSFLSLDASRRRVEMESM
jgi:hypothetical protein